MADVARMRWLWPRVARRLAEEGWTEADLLEARGLLADAVAAGDALVLAGWLEWLEDHDARALRLCAMCAAFRQPKGTDGFCGASETDLPPAFSIGHPLKRLPVDGGVSCVHWRVV